MTDKRILSLIIGVSSILLFIGGYFGYQEILKRSAIPMVSSANFSLEYRKIPFDTKSIDITFSTSLDKDSITDKIMTVSPFLEGKIELKDTNTLSYVLSQKLTIGETYAITIAPRIRSLYGKELGSEKIFTFEAIAGAQATKILPSGKLENIGQNIVVLFNIPLVSLSHLDGRDKLPCPLEISPKVEGNCKWTNGNVLEFIPNKPLELATKYHIKVSDRPGLLYPLMGILEDNIVTPELAINIFSDSFDPVRGIIVRTSAPVDQNKLSESLVITNGSGVKLETHVTSIKNSENIESETEFVVTPKTESFFYASNYGISIRKGLIPKYGNEPLATDFSAMLKSVDFLSDSQVFQNIFNASGTLSDTREYNSKYGFPFTDLFPTERVFFRQTFMMEMELNKELFTLQTQSGKTVDFTLAYVKQTKYDNNGNAIGEENNKRMIDITPVSVLENSMTYQIVINKKANNSLISDVIKTYKTAPKFQILGNTFLSNTEICIYTSTNLDTNGFYAFGYDMIKTVPASKVHDLMADGQMDWQTNKKIYRCDQRPDQISYILGMRLEPNKQYSMVIPANFDDIYGNKLGKDVSFQVQTKDIDMKDMYLYSSLNNPVQIIPNTLPIVLNLLSVNRDKANLEVCEMDANGYRDYLTRGGGAYYNPECTRVIGKTVSLKNRFWNLTPNKIDIEKDILGYNSKSPFLLVRASIGSFNNSQNGYMDDGREFLHVFVRSNLALTLEDGHNTKILFASSFDGKTLPDNLTFDTYTRNNQGNLELKPFPIKWNHLKKYYELTDPENKLSFIIAKNNQFHGVLNKYSDQVSNYDFKYISGQDSTTREYLYMYSDRPLYKAGDTVFYKGLLRQFNFNGYKASQEKIGKLKVVDENGGILIEVDVKVDKNSNFNGSFVLPKDMSLGHYRFDFYMGADAIPVYNNGEFDVLAYKKPVFKVNIETNKPDVSIGDNGKISAHSEYYFGGRLARADYAYSILTQSYFFDAKDYRDYQFGKGSDYFDCVYWGSCAFRDNLINVATGRLDKNGETTFSYEYPKNNNPENIIGENIYTFIMDITDPDTGKTVSNQASQILHTTDAYVGLRAPYWNLKKDGVKVNGVVLDYDAKGLSSKKVKLEFWKREWKEVKKQGVDGTFYNEGSIEEKKEFEKTLSSDFKGEWGEVIHPMGDGEYEIRAMYTGINKQTFTSSTILYVSGENPTYWNDGNNTITDLIADKTMLKVGDIAGFTLKSPVSSGKMLITIEKDDGVLDSFVRDITSNTPRIEIPIKESYVPNFYVKVFLIGQDAGAKLPTYKRALAVMKVTTDPKRLSIVISPEKKQYLPGDKVTLTIGVKDSNGKPVSGANGSLSVVDESLLALAGNSLKNPFAFFYDMKRYLGIETYVSLVNLIEKLEVKDTSLGEKGGAGEGTKGGSSRKKRGIFKDTAFWQADFTTDKNGQVSITTDVLPDNLTTWVIEALVSTTEGNKVGIATEKIMTTKTVMINENLPRFLGSSDRVTFSPVIFNKTGKDQSFDVSIIADNMTIKSPTRTVYIKNGASYTVPFEATITEIPLSSTKPFSSKIILKAMAKDSGELDEVENILPIEVTSTKETIATVGKTTNSADERIKLPSDIRKNGGSLTITYAPSILPNIFSGIEYLKSFPYGCSEQRTSAIMPTIYLKKLYDSVNMPFDLKTKTVKEYIDQYEGYQERSLDTVVRGYLVEIKNFQRLNGGFGYWMDSEYDDLPLTINIVSALSSIYSIGYTSNETVMENAIKYLKTKFYENKRPYCFDDKECDLETSTRLAIIKSILDNTSQDYEAYKMYKLLSFEKPDNLTQVNRIRVLAKILRIPSLSKDEKDLLTTNINEQIRYIVSNNLVYNPRGAFLGSSEISSRLTITTRFLETLSFMDPVTLKEYEQIVDQMTRWIISQKKKDGSFGSTLDTTNVIRSLAHIMRTAGELRDVNMQIKISLDGVNIDEKGIDQKNKLDTFSKVLGLDALQDNSNLHFERAGEGTLYYDIATSYQIPSKDIPARDEGFFVEQIYFDYNEYKNIKKAKEEEWAQYLSGSIAFKDLKYPKEIVTYLNSLEDFTIGKLVYVYNRIITGETRDQVAFEGFIPSGSELINPDLKTENTGNKLASIFEHEEYQNDRYFGTMRSMESGIYTFGYIIRPTHSGAYQLRPSRVFEFYRPEVFGRVGGKIVKVVERK